jgi:predicted 3-demethylubiquinone-9 3-methyltransferase (glyoxalase superfamily)
VQKITTTFLMDDRIEEAVNFYVSLFKDSKVTNTARYGDAMPSMKGKVLTMSFELGGEEYLAINGGMVPHFTDTISLMVHCDDQAEVDRYWNALTANGGKEGQCGWLKDRFGMSWQITPKQMSSFIGGPDRAGATRAMGAMMKMHKIVLADMEKAYVG